MPLHLTLRDVKLQLLDTKSKCKIMNESFCPFWTKAAGTTLKYLLLFPTE